MTALIASWKMRGRCFADGEGFVEEYVRLKAVDGKTFAAGEDDFITELIRAYLSVITDFGDAMKDTSFQWNGAQKVLSDEV